MAQQLLHRFFARSGIGAASIEAASIEVWLTPCIVTNPPTGADLLVVPANERLCGTQFAHFPAGGPTPSAPRIGAEPRSSKAPRSANLLYPCQSVDGVLTEFAGPDFWAQIAALPPVDGYGDYAIKCRPGGAVHTSAPRALGFSSGLVHAVSPFHGAADWQAMLKAAYANAFDVSFSRAAKAVACPLLGSGSRGVPVGDTADAAAACAVDWLDARAPGSGRAARLCFGVLDDDAAKCLETALRRGATSEDDR